MKNKKKKGTNFWLGLKKPFFVLAPMADVTDFAFREMFAKYGKPDVMWTEFVSADGLSSSGKNRLLHHLKFSEKERPIVAQLFGSKPEKMEEASRLIVNLGFDGLDINMGCPDKAIQKQGAGASLMKDPDLALQIIDSARLGVENKIPVSVKTRIGFNSIDLGWIEFLLKQKLPVLTVHLRTKKEMSLVPAHWDIMPEIIKLRDQISRETLIIGNGDINSMADGREKIEKYGCDGVMIGRGLFGKPWFFDADVTHPQNLKILIEHTKLFEKTFKGIKSFDLMKKHFKAYVSGWKGAKELRISLMDCKDYMCVRKIINKYILSIDISKKK